MTFKTLKMRLPKRALVFFWLLLEIAKSKIDFGGKTKNNFKISVFI